MLQDRYVCSVFLSVKLVHCCQTVGWINMPLGTEVGLVPGGIVRWDPAVSTPHGKGHNSPPTFRPTLLWHGRPSQQLLHRCTAHGRQFLYFTMGCQFPLKIAPSHGGSGPHLIHGSFGPPESTTLTASRSVRRFLQGSRS